MNVFAYGKKSLQRLAATRPDLSTRTFFHQKPLPTEGIFSKNAQVPGIDPHFGPKAPKNSPHHQLVTFDQLKREERRQFSNRSRVRFPYASNHSGALSLPYSQGLMRSKMSNEIDLLSLCESYIIEHANRRVDLFFYILVAYYQTSVLPVEGHTSLQHGMGRKFGGTQACHSSLIPSLLDNTIFQNGSSPIKFKSLLSGTHLLESLNSTVELPHCVNAFDDVIESLCRPKCIEILRKVSIGTITPVNGLNFFLNTMNTILQEFKRQAGSKSYSSLAHPLLHGKHHVNPKLIDMVIEGTLNTSFLTDTRTVNEDYIQLLLRMTPREKIICSQSTSKKESLYLEKFLSIQTEILQTKSSERLFTT